MWYLFYFCVLIFTGVQLTYWSIVVSGVRQIDSTIHIHISTLFCRFSHTGLYTVLSRVAEYPVRYSRSFLFCAQSLSPVWLLVTTWTIARQTPLSMGILKARILEWVAMPSSRGSPRPRDRTQVSCIAGRFLTREALSRSSLLFYFKHWVSLVAQRVKYPPAMQESVQSLSCVQLFVTSCTSSRQASPFITNSWNPLKLMSIASVMPSEHLILSSPSPPTFNLAQHQGLFKWVGSSHQVAKGLKFQLQHQSFQWIFRTDFL